MLLAYVLQLAIVWVLQPVKSVNILFIHRCLQWVRRLSSTSFLLFGEISESISGRQRETPGTIFNSNKKSHEFFVALLFILIELINSFFINQFDLIVSKITAPFFAFSPYFFNASALSRKVIR